MTAPAPAHGGQGGAGLELDAAVGHAIGADRSVFECPRCHDEQGYFRTWDPTVPPEQFIRECKACRWQGSDAECFRYPEYSTEIEEAMMLLDDWHGDWKIRRHNGQFKVTMYEPSMQGSEWAETLPLAICRMRLRAAGWTLTAAEDRAAEAGGA